MDRSHPEVPTDRYYCEYQYQTFRATICGKVDVDQFAEISGQDVYFPTVASGCGQNLCFCHAHSDAFYDFNLEFLCREGEPVHFASQWSQDYFLVHNVLLSLRLKMVELFQGQQKVPQPLAYV